MLHMLKQTPAQWFVERFVVFHFFFSYKREMSVIPDIYNFIVIANIVSQWHPSEAICAALKSHMKFVAHFNWTTHQFNTGMRWKSHHRNNAVWLRRKGGVVWFWGRDKVICIVYKQVNLVFKEYITLNFIMRLIKNPPSPNCHSVIKTLQPPVLNSTTCIWYEQRWQMVNLKKRW